MSKQRITLVTTGGTIATRGEGAGGAQLALTGEDLLAALPQARAFAEVAVESPLQLPGSHMSLSDVLTLAERVEALLAADAVDGVVITHGTDTLEETAYLLHLTLRSEKPVVVTGSMRTASQVGYDGYRNILDALRVAATPQAAGLGTLVVFNEEIHSARWVTKTHTQKVETFQSPAAGRLGVVHEHGVSIYLRPALSRRPLDKRLESRVTTLHLGLDPDASPIRHVLADGVAGMVVAAFGGGRIPPKLLHPLQQLLDRGVPVVATTRGHWGVLGDPYAYEGAFADLKRRGIIFARDLPAHKCRLQLMLALANLEGVEEIRRYFENT